MSDLVHDLTLDAVSPTDDVALRAWFELYRDAQATDLPDDPPPCWVAHRASLRCPWPGEEAAAVLARLHDQVVAVGVLNLPQLDNTDNATAEVVVAPAHRHRGIGRHVLVRLGDDARRAGRVRLIGETRSPLVGRAAAGSWFARSVGAREALVEVRRRLHLDPADHGAGPATDGPTRGGGRGDGDDLVQWTDGTPEEWLDDIARLTARMSTDAPLGDLHWAPERYDAQRVRDRDVMCREAGLRVVVTAARAPDDTLAAFTEIARTATVTTHAWNWDTLVQPEHRGHGLGLRIKLANLALARAAFPELRAVDTVNAASNTHMIAVNEAIGFRALDRYTEWELDL